MLTRHSLTGQISLLCNRLHKNTSKGTLRFPGWDLASVVSNSPDVLVSTEVIGNSLVAAFRYSGVGAPPECCDVELLWRGNPNSAKVRLPFPAWGARCFDARGRDLPDHVILSTENLFGIRLVAFLGRTDNVTLSLDLVDGDIESDFSRFKISTPEGATRVEVRLIDYLSKVRRMLGNADGLDAFVRVELQVGTAQRTSVRVARYACELTKASETQRVWLSADTLKDLEPDEMAKLSAVAANVQWPTDLQHEIARARTSPLGRFLHSVDFRFRDTVVNLPILLATSVATGIPLDWVQVQTEHFGLVILCTTFR